MTKGNRIYIPKSKSLVINWDVIFDDDSKFDWNNNTVYCDSTDQKKPADQSVSNTESLPKPMEIIRNFEENGFDSTTPEVTHSSTSYLYNSSEIIVIPNDFNVPYDDEHYENFSKNSSIEMIISLGKGILVSCILQLTH